MNMSIFPLTALVAICATATVSGQGVLEYGSPQAYQKATFGAMRQGNWKLALANIDKCIELYGERYNDLAIGDKFGWFYYQKGVCHMQLKEFAEALSAFDTCYTKFPKDENEFGRSALFGAGEAKFSLEDYDGALVSLDKFIKERRTTGNSPDTRINVGQVYSVIAQCHMLSSKPNFAEGTKALASCIQNRYRGQGIADSYIVDATLNMIKASLQLGKTAEAIDFIRKHPSSLNIGPDRMSPFCVTTVNLAAEVWKKLAEAQDKGDTKLADDCYQLVLILSAVVPDKADVQVSIRPMVDMLNTLKLPAIRYQGINYLKYLYDASLKSYDKMEVPIESYAVKNIASIYGNMGSARLAKSAFQVMEERYPMAQDREQNLFRLIATTWQLGDFDQGNKYIDTFVKAYPKSEYMGIINSLSIESLLKQGKFDECLVQARKLKELYKDDQQNDFYILASFCEASSLFQLKRYTEAVPFYVEFLKSYEDTRYAQQAIYQLGSAYLSLRNWDEAIKTMGRYITKFPEKDEKNTLLPFAYYERAFSYAQRNNEGDDENCIQDCKYIIDNFKTVKVYPNALVMLGNIYSTSDGEDADARLKEANELYLMALETAKEQKNLNVASEAIYNLVTNYAMDGTPEGKAEAQKYYDLFWKEVDDPEKSNDFALRIGVEGMRLNKEGGPAFDAAVTKLQQIIVREGRRDALNPAVEQAIGAYSTEYFDTMQAMGKPLTQDQAKEHFYNFPGLTNEDMGLRTLLRTALIDVYQAMISNAKPEDTNLKAELEGAVNVFFQELERDFKPADLSTYTLLKLGTHLSRSSQSLRSIPYFDEILKRNKESVRDARFNKAIALGLSKEAARIDEGIELMSRELDNERNQPAPDYAAMEEAQYYLTQFYFDKQDYDKTLEQADKYLEVRSNTKNKVNVLLLQAEAYEKKNDLDRALVAYLNIAGLYTPRVSVSAPATVKVMELYWQRNRPKPNATQEDLLKSSDRHLAWKEGASYVRKMKPNESKMTIPDRNKFRAVEELTKKYGNDPAIMAEDKAIEDRKAAIKQARGQK